MCYRIWCRHAVLLVGLAVCCLPAAAQISPELYSGMKWRDIGPFRGGRVLAVTGVPGDPATWYFGAVAGGVWKSGDVGQTWKPLFDEQKIASIGAIAVADSDPNVLYVGTGEASPRGDITYGDGIYKSVDGGKTWRNVGLRDTRHIGALIIDPKNPEIVFVAALGHAFGPNEERGVFRTGDGGKSWQKVLYKDQVTGAIDIVFDPHNSNVLYATLWQMRRQPWSFSSGGPGSGIYKSTDGGRTWQHLEGNGLPEGILGRIGVSVSGTDSERVYALIEAKEGGLFRSDDAGRSWTRINDDHRFRQRAWYFSRVFADPSMPDAVYIMNTGAFRSSDGGRSFDLLPAPHGDHHALWIDPTNSRRMIEGSDGGASVSVDGGQTWSSVYNQPTAQFYHVAVDNNWPYRVYGAQQDNGTIGIASRSDDGRIGREAWYDVGGGESGYIAPDPRDPEIVYANADSGQMTRYDHRANHLRDVSVYPLDVSGNGAENLEYRLQWTEPVFVSPHDSNVLYTAAQFVLKSSDRGRSWKAISPDLTRNDKSKQKPSGGPITLDITSVEYYDTVFALAESPLQQGMLWAGTDDGRVQLTRNDGATWDNVTPKDMPEWSLISIIDPSPFDAGSAYVAVDRHRLDDAKPLIYKTHDGGRSWTRIVSGIPDGAYVRSVREDPKQRGLLYAGTELGVYVSLDDGAHWQSLQLNLPVAPVHDLIVKDDDLVAATHGRSFWILDDLTPLRQMKGGFAAEEAHLYEPQAAIRLHFPMEFDHHISGGKTPPHGAIIDYYLKTKPAADEEIVLEILDAKGALLRHLSNHKPPDAGKQPAEWPDREQSANVIPAEPGMNRFAWDLRHEDPTAIPGAFYPDDGPKGWLAIPGHYQARMTVHGKSQTMPFEVKIDPRLAGLVTAADLEKVQDLAQKVFADIDLLHRTVNEIRATRTNLETLHNWIGADPAGHDVLAEADKLEAHMLPVEHELIQVDMKASEDNLRYPNELNEQYDTFSYVVDSNDFAPTESQLNVYAELHRRLDAQLALWHEIAAQDVAAINGLMRVHGLPKLGAQDGG
jgi:photosystem II stability/assembly factor-like uncharacterized protein